MRAIVVREFGGPSVMHVEDVPAPAPGPGQVLVRIRAIGVNPVETYIRAGTYARRPPLPYTPGTDAAGIVEQVGHGVPPLAVGERVYVTGTAEGAPGAYAEMALCELSQVHRLPDSLSFQQGAAVGVPYRTACRALFQRGQGRPGETVLVHGASGSVGTAAIQLARAAGLVILATAGTDRGLELVSAQGAGHAFDHRVAGYQGRIMDATGGRGVDLVLEMLANVNLNADLALLAPRGRIVVIGNRGTIEIDPRRAMARDADIRGMQLGNTPPEAMIEIEALLEAGLRDGTLVPVVAREFPLEQAPQAHEAVLSPGAHGKIVLAIDR